MTVVAIPDWREGKQTRRGQPTPTQPSPVVIVSGDSIDWIIGARSVKERQRFLRHQRDLGVLIATRGCTARLRRGEQLDGTRTVYVFRVSSPDELPRIRPREHPAGRERVIEW